MKLVIQIPCYNEEKTLTTVLHTLPKKISGIDEIDVLVIDDGSTDTTLDIARKNGVKFFVILPRNSGLGNAHREGIQKALKMGADIIVNIDGDNQYNADDIEKLIQPILNKDADVVIGERPILKIKEWSLIKKFFQKFGTFIVKTLSSVDIKDTTSGFRAYNREAAIKLNLFEQYSYTQEIIFQLKPKGLTLKNVPIRVNSNLRKSRLMKNMWHYISRQASVILRSFIIYHPFYFMIATEIFISFLMIFWGYIFYTENILELPLLFWLTSLFFLCMSSILFSSLSIQSINNRKILEEILLNQKKNNYQ